MSMIINSTPQEKSKYTSVYITPIADQGENKLCMVEEVLGNDVGHKYNTKYIYPKGMFEKYFHGTLIMFCKDGKQITSTEEIKENFDIRFEYVKAFNLETGMLYASDGVAYDFNNNYFCNHNRQTKQNIELDLLKCNSFYMHLIIDELTGHILDVTLIADPKKSSKFAYKHRVVKGFVPTNMLDLRDLKKSGNNSNSNEKLSQDDIDKLITDIYAKDRSFTL